MRALAWRVLQLLQARFLNYLDLVANELQTRHITAQFGARIRRQWFIFWAAQYRETVACLAQLDVEGANAKPDQRRLHPVHDTGSLLHQRLVFAVRTSRVFFRNRRDRCHAAVLRLATRPAENRPHQQSGIQSVRLCSPMFARHRDTGRVDHIGLDPAAPQPARKPEAVAASLEWDDNPVDCAAGL